MIIYLDFDGTVVEHKFPEIGQYNDNAFDVIKKLQDSGHEIILNTYRADMNDGSLEKAIFYINYNSIGEINTISNHTTSKIYPKDFDINSFINEGIIFIDDVCRNTPLKELGQSNVVDWYKLDSIFHLNGIYK